MIALWRRLYSLLLGAVTAPFVILLGMLLVQPVRAQSADELVENRATVTYTDANGNAGRAEAFAVVLISRSGSLDLRKLVDQAAARAGDTLTYTLRWSNVGVGQATSVIITDSLPQALSFIPGSVRSAQPVTTSVLGNVLRFQVNDVPIGAAAELRFSAVVNRATEEIRNSARADFSMEGAPGESTSDTTRTRIDTSEPKAADLRLGKRVDRGSAVPGDTLLYTITWRNLGAGIARGTQVLDTLPGSVRFLSGSVTSGRAVMTNADGGVLRFSLGDVVAGDSASLTFAVVVQEAEGTAANFATAAYESAGKPAGTASDTTSTLLHGASDLQLTKLVDRTLAGQGDTLTYTLRWYNPGPGRARAVLITDTLPLGLTYVPGSAVVGGADNVVAVNGQALEYASPDLRPGERAELTFRALVSATEGDLQNVAQARFVSDDSTRTVTSDTVRTRLDAPRMELEIVALVDRPLHVGDTLTYRITLTNTHPQLTLYNVLLTDSIAPELEYLGADPEPFVRSNAIMPGSSRNGPAGFLAALGDGGRGGEVSWLFNAIEAGGRRVILLHTLVHEVGTGQLINIAIAAGSGITQALAAVATVLAEEPSDLELRKSASALEAGSGDAVGYTIQLQNTGLTTLDDIEVRDLPDAGLRIQKSSITGAVLNDAGGELVLAVGSLAPGQRATVQYVATVASARGRTLTNAAYATTGRGLRTDTVRSVIRVRDAAMLTRVVVGKVWLDENGDGRQQPDERPLSHALIWTAFGETVRADSLGRFTFPDLIAGRHTFRLDPLSVPGGYRNAEPVSVRLDGFSSPVVQFGVRRGGTQLLTHADSLAAGFLFGGETLLRRPRIASPRDGAIIGTNKMYVRVEGEPMAKVKLWRDGQPIAETQLRPDGTEDFMDITVEPGEHVFAAVVTGPDGDERVEVHVHASGAPREVQRADTAELRAGRPQLLALRVLDEWKMPVAQKPLATVSVGGAMLLEPDADASSNGVQVPVAEGGMLLLRVRADSAVTARVNVSFGREVSPIDVLVLPEIRSLVLLADGEIGAGASARSYGAAVARGALDERTSVTLSYDSRRTRDRGFGGAFDPLGESRYSVLGDASSRMVLGSATTPLALRVERDQSWLQVGDINTRAFGSENSPASYTRALPGVSALWRRGGIDLTGFGSQVAQQLVQQQLRGNGTSGPYHLGGAIRLGTDRLAIETRDARNASIVVNRQELERFIDYDIDATTGSVLLRRPLASTDAAGNPQMLVALAERVDGNSAFVGGLRGQVTLTPFGARDSLTLGSAYIDDQSSLGGHRLISGDLVAATRWGGSRLELARGETADSAGIALRAGAWLGSRDGTGATLEWLRVGNGFANPANPRLLAGTEDMRFSGRLKLGGAYAMNAGASRQSFEAQGAQRMQTSLGFTRTNGDNKLALDLGLLDEQLDRDTVSADYTSLTSRLSYTVRKNSAWVEALRSLRSNGEGERPSTYGVGVSYDVGFGVHAEAAQRLLVTDSAKSSMTTLGLRTELPTGTRGWSEYQLGSSVGGSQSAALVGIGQKLRLADGWSVDAQYERRQGLSQLPETDVSRALPFAHLEQDRWSASIGAEWAPTRMQARAALRGELNDGKDTGRGYRIFGTGEAALSTSWTLLLRQDARESHRETAEGTVRTRAAQSILAAAFRPAARSDWTGLVKLERRHDENPLRNGGAMLSGTDQRLIGAVETVWTPATGNELGMRFALRHSSLGGLLAAGNDISTNTQYAGLRGKRQLTDRIDARITTRLLTESLSSVSRWDAAPALGVKLISGLELEAGYRFGDLVDADFAQNGGHGFYATLGMSITEQSGRTLADFWRNRIAGGDR